MENQPDFKNLWRENHVARYDREEDVLHIYTRNLSGAAEVETEETENHIDLKVDAETGELLGFSIPRFSAVKEIVETGGSGPAGI